MPQTRAVFAFFGVLLGFVGGLFTLVGGAMLGPTVRGLVAGRPPWGGEGDAGYAVAAMGLIALVAGLAMARGAWTILRALRLTRGQTPPYDHP